MKPSVQRIFRNICEQVTEMASSKCKGFPRKKRRSEPDIVVSSLRKENAFLKKALLELSRQHSDHYKLVERLISLQSVRLENSRRLTARDEKTTLPSEPSGEGAHLVDEVSMETLSDYAREIEGIKNKLVSFSTRCHYLENKVAGKKDSESDEEDSDTGVTELQSGLRDLCASDSFLQSPEALEKKKQWLEYDQQREVYVSSVMARILWLEQQLNEANRALSKQHNEEHSDEKKQMRQMQEYYDRLLQKAKDELEVLRQEVNVTHQNLTITQNWCQEREVELEELKQQLQNEESSRQSLPDKNKALQYRLLEERHRSANSELQVNLLQKFMQNQQQADQEKIADLERQLRISSEDLEDARQECEHLKKQVVRVLKSQRKTEHQLSRDSPKSFNLLDESFLECPGCKTEYPASHHRELMNHIEICFD
ncbi:centrosomal protein of 55 kDa-like isoform X2 [Scophthalmus maximus]|uniref:centrosomal protein of 55 kDa-like isoform X2 n=1 Tax=Scophthalmus maximus TaxID=52904 RepID=UPI0015E07993|nr:centrosomal protein of 55 kDa-like isoform X2 [Scophthalmus maximus]